MERRTIYIEPLATAPGLKAIIPIPEDRDAEEYIDELLDEFLNEKYRYVDGLS